MLSHLETTCHPGLQDNSNCPMVADTALVPTPVSIVCGLLHHSILLRSTLATMIHLRPKVVPSILMEALVQHYEAAGFSEEVSRLAIAPVNKSHERR